MSMFIELTDKQTGALVLLNVQTSWHILDTGKNHPARWYNPEMAMNYHFNESYSQVKERLIASGLLVDINKCN